MVIEWQYLWGERCADVLRATVDAITLQPAYQYTEITFLSKLLAVVPAKFSLQGQLRYLAGKEIYRKNIILNTPSKEISDFPFFSTPFLAGDWPHDDQF